ncbi:NAD(P)-dependent glycerol-1-phosphate dehydrogenase [Methanocalculus taiwanensis]|uniref:Glycerol-1-phosphate dehydrogenase [NAD(P)+] n=1 Tax=Methanocalculus taiwanensis TaxID=106207 RepID=A0ABD4TKX0_9EURY|nr:NAD(P)-dependent glycerol-1-phosphate dehydrogenase [Methanocalculus taiwanensis]MCQ1539466.1 NAD(P)-dependent glycerol-1-phosphate dehydrogenase [Methanocalculus taiwanensis]
MSSEYFKILKNKVFDKSKWMQLPRDVVIGHDALDQIPRVLEELALGRSVLLLSGPRTNKAVGDRVASLIEGQFDLTRHVTDAITPETIRLVEEIGSSADLIVAVGGGRVIDTAKIASFNLDCQFVSVPTAASHDGIASSRASVPTDEGSSSLDAHPPVAIVADTGIIAAAPHRLLASGCADIISNYTAILDWELAHRLRGEVISEYAIALSRMTAEILVKDAHLILPNSEESAWLVTKALVSSGVAMSIAGSSRPASGGEHKFGHAVERLMPGKVLHGEACGIGTIISMYLHGGDWRGIRTSLKKIGAPTTPAEVGLPDHIAAEALMKAKEIRPERFTIFDMGITEDSAAALIRMLYRE